METLLKVLGGVALFAIVLVALVALAFWLFLRFTVGKIKRLAQNMGGPVAPVAIEVAVLDGTPKPETERLAGDLERAGFQRIGAFGALGIPNYEMIALTNPADDVYGIAAYHPMTGAYVELFQSAPDGRTLTVTGSKEMSPPPPIPGRTVVRRTGAGVETLMNEFRVARLTGEVYPAPPEGFAPAFEAEYRRVMEFQYTQGALKGTDLAELTNLSGMQTDPATAEFLGSIGAENIVRDQTMRNDFLASGVVSAAEWEAMRDDALFVADSMDDEELADLLLEIGGEEVEDDFLPAEIDEVGGVGGRERFRNALARMGQSGRVELAGSLGERPDPFDVYRIVG